MNIVVDKILEILKNNKITKKEFATKLIDLNPKVGIKSEPPSQRTIYLYLQGKREIKADLIPYIAEVLHINEQELFRNNYDALHVSEPTIQYKTTKNTLEHELIDLLPYVPEAMIKTFIQKAKDVKNITLE